MTQVACHHYGIGTFGPRGEGRSAGAAVRDLRAAAGIIGGGGTIELAVDGQRLLDLPSQFVVVVGQDCRGILGLGQRADIVEAAGGIALAIGEGVAVAQRIAERQIGPHDLRPSRSAPEQMSGLARPGLDEAGIEPVGARQAKGQAVSVTGRQDQMNVVGHLTSGPERNAEAAAGLGRQVAVEAVVARLAAFAALRDAAIRKRQCG